MSVPFTEIKSHIRPFDIIAFKGGNLVSSLISTFEEFETDHGEFSHVGMVITKDILECIHTKDTYFKLKKNVLYIVESTRSAEGSIPDIATGNFKFGVQLRELTDVITNYLSHPNSKVAWCKLKDNPIDAKIHLLKIKFSKIFHSLYGKHYDMSLLALAAAMFPSLRTIRDTKDEMCTLIYEKCGLKMASGCPSEWQFCSEIIAEIYKEFGVWGDECNPKDVLPVDFFGYDTDGLKNVIESTIYIH